MAILVDGRIYGTPEEAPDLGSIRAVYSDGDFRKYEGLIEDAAKLPTYVSHGSTALLYDGTGITKVYKFNAVEKDWFEI